MNNKRLWLLVFVVFVSSVLIVVFVFKPHRSTSALSPADPAVVASCDSPAVIAFSGTVTAAEAWVVTPPQAGRCWITTYPSNVVPTTPPTTVLPSTTVTTSTATPPTTTVSPTTTRPATTTTVRPPTTTTKPCRWRKRCQGT